MWGWRRKKPEAQQAQEAQQALQQAVDQVKETIIKLSEVLRKENPEQWPGNLLMVLAHLNLTFLASFREADDVLEAFGVALNLEHSRLVQASMQAPPMPSRRVH